jgi:hypothetical protein
MSVLVVFIVLCLLAFRYNLFPNLKSNAGVGFSPDWDCTPMPKGDPICIKKLGR